MYSTTIVNNGAEVYTDVCKLFEKWMYVCTVIHFVSQKVLAVCRVLVLFCFFLLWSFFFSSFHFDPDCVRGVPIRWILRKRHKYLSSFSSCKYYRTIYNALLDVIASQNSCPTGLMRIQSLPHLCARFLNQEGHKWCHCSIFSVTLLRCTI